MAIRHGEAPYLTADPTLAEEDLGFHAKKGPYNIVSWIYLLQTMSRFNCTRLVYSASAAMSGTPPVVPIPETTQLWLLFSTNNFAPSRGIGVHGSLTNAPLSVVASFSVAVTLTEPGAPRKARIGSGSLHARHKCPTPNTCRLPHCFPNFLITR